MKNKNIIWILGIFLLIIVIKLTGSAEWLGANIPVLNSTSGLNESDEMAICNIEGGDVSSDTVTNITNFVINNVSYTNLNMPMDTNSSTTTKDYSGYGNNGNVSFNATDRPSWKTTADCRIGGCYNFDGIDDDINLGANSRLKPINNFTVEAWVNISNTAINTRFISDWHSVGTEDRWLFYVNAGNSLAWYVTNANGVTAASISYNYGLAPNQWLYLVGIYNGTNTLLYVNGALIETGVLSGNLNAGSDIYNIKIGHQDEAGGFFNGTIDEVRIYNRSLSAEEILLHNATNYNQISLNMTKRGDYLHCEVTPNNNTADGVSKNSTTMYVNAQQYLSICNDEVLCQYDTNSKNVTQLFLGTNNSARTITFLQNNTVFALNGSLTYNFTGSTTWIRDTSHNATFDCNGSTLLGGGQVGSVLFNALDYNNATLKNCNAKLFDVFYRVNDIGYVLNNNFSDGRPDSADIYAYTISVGDSNQITLIDRNNFSYFGDNIAYAKNVTNNYFSNFIGYAFSCNDGKTCDIINNTASNTSGFLTTEGCAGLGCGVSGTRNIKNNKIINSTNDVFYSTKVGTGTPLTIFNLINNTIANTTWKLFDASNYPAIAYFYNNTFHNLNISSVTNDTEQYNKWNTSLSPIVYNNGTLTTYDTCVKWYNSAGAQCVANVTSDDFTGVDTCSNLGTNNYNMWLYQNDNTDDITCGGIAYSKITIFIDSAYTAIDCPGVAATYGGTCAYVQTSALTQNGANTSYSWNDTNLGNATYYVKSGYITPPKLQASQPFRDLTIDNYGINLNSIVGEFKENIIGSDYLSLVDNPNWKGVRLNSDSNFNITKNHFYQNLSISGTAILCQNGEGNFYRETLAINASDCGQNITQPINNTNFTVNNININLFQSRRNDKTLAYNLFVNGIFDSVSESSFTKSFSDGTYRISFSAYDGTYNSTTAKEITFSVLADVVPSVGGGGGKVTPTEVFGIFAIEETSVKLATKVGQEKIGYLTITNIGKETVTISIINNLKEYISLTDKISLAPLETKKIPLTINYDNPGIYNGNLILKTSGLEKTIPVIIEILSKIPLVDISLYIPEKYREIKIGDKLKTEINLLGRIEDYVNIIYSIKDLTGLTILEKNETIFIGDQKSLMREFILPPNIKEGDYLFSVQTIYKDSFSVSNDIFKVKKTFKEYKIKPGYIIIGIIVSLIVLFIILRRHKAVE